MKPTYLLLAVACSLLAGSRAGATEELRKELAVVAADEGCESCEPAPAVVPLAPLIAPAKRAA